MCSTASSPAWAKTTVRFTNHDQVHHVVVGTQWGIADEILPGRTAEHQFSRRGTFPYSCHVHPGMNGVVVVGEPASGAAASNASTPAALTSSSTSAAASDLPPLALGAIAGLAIGSVRPRLRRRC